MSVLSPNSNVYAWIGPLGGLWGTGANWQDLTAGANPAGTPPGALTPVTISGPTGLTYLSIGGGGISASLLLTGRVALTGATTTGALSIGSRAAAGLGSSSVSYVYAAGALIVSTSLTAGTINLASGSLGFANAGASLTAAGAITVGAQSVIGNGPSSSYDPGAGANISLAAGTTLTGAGSMAIVQGSILVNGAGASASFAGPVTLGAAGVSPVAGYSYAFDSVGSIAIMNGGVFAVSNSLTALVGSVSVDGAGSRLNVQSVLTLGLAASTGYGAGSLIVTNGGGVRAGNIVIQAPATSHAGTAATYPASVLVDGFSSIEVGSGVAAIGTITIDTGSSVTVTTDAGIVGNIVDNGVLSEAGGNLTLTGNLSGTGVLLIGRNGTVTMNGNIAASDRIAFADPTASLIVGTNAASQTPFSIGATISGFQLGDSIVFGVAANSVSYTATATNLGLLTLFNAGTAVANLVFLGNYTPGGFVLSPTTSGGGSIGLLAPQTGSGGMAAPNAHAYSWIGATGSYWGVTTNWVDLQSTNGTTEFVPGAQTPVTILGPTGPTYAVIRGGGFSASLALTGNVALNGFFITGALTVGSGIVQGAGSSSVSTIYAAGALIVAVTVTATSVNLVNGNLSLAGIGATLAVSGGITVGVPSLIRNSAPSSYDPGSTASIRVAAGTSLNSQGAMAIRQGSISVNGPGANVTATAPVSLGVAGVPPAAGSPYSYDASGTIEVVNGGVFTVASSLTEFVGSINVTGAGSRLTVQTVLTLGLGAATSYGNSSLNVANGGAVQADGIAIQAPATRYAGTAVISAPSLFVDALSSLKIGAGVAAAGTITIDPGKSIAGTTNAAITGSIVDNGILSETGGNLTLTGNLSGTGTLLIGSFGWVTMNGNVAASNRILFADPTAGLIIGTNPVTQALYSISAVISGFQLGNSLQSSLWLSTIGYAATGANTGTLTLLNGNTVRASLVLAGNYTSRSFVLSPSAGGGSAIRVQTVPLSTALSDFNADGRADILWQNDDGSGAIWAMNGTARIGGGIIGNPGPSWHMKGTGDFNGDGRSDVLWQNDNGSVAIWQMSATSYIGGAVVGNPGASWHVKGSGDFNGDGKADILWQSDNGSVAIWLMNATSYIGGAVVGNPGASWHVIGSGDFNGDGKADILWQNDNGSVAIWLMNATSYIGGAVVGNPGSSWHVKGAGDFNGDGKADILWQNDNGSVAIWLMNGTSNIGGAIAGNPGGSWHVKGSGDYNGDGKSDILWQHDDGSAAIWKMNGTSNIGGAVVGNAGTSWHTIGSDGMRFISGATGNSTLAATSENDTFVFTSYAAGLHAIRGFDPAHDLIQFSLAKFANFAAVKAQFTASGSDTMINLGGGSSLRVQGIVPGVLNASDFRFV